MFVLSYNYAYPRDYPEQYFKMAFMTKYVLSFCVLLFIGCATFGEKKQQNLFEIASHAYEQAILLGKYEIANGFRKVQASEKQVLTFERLKKIKVTSYELLTTIKVSKDMSLVNQTVEIKYYNLDYMTEKTIVDKQLWKYYAEEKTWYLQSGLPNFK